MYACDGDCCVGYYACQRFTGKVCKDGSCTGSMACRFATIPFVVNSCKGGYYGACYKAGSGGSVGNIVNSCHGRSACEQVGYKGVAGNIQDSCKGERSCFDAGAKGGSIGGITASCDHLQACSYIGYGSPLSLDLTSCCNYISYDHPPTCYRADKDSILASCSTAASVM